MNDSNPASKAFTDWLSYLDRWINKLIATVLIHTTMTSWIRVQVTVVKAAACSPRRLQHVRVKVLHERLNPELPQSEWCVSREMNNSNPASKAFTDSLFYLDKWINKHITTALIHTTMTSWIRVQVNSGKGCSVLYETTAACKGERYSMSTWTQNCHRVNDALTGNEGFKPWVPRHPLTMNYLYLNTGQMHKWIYCYCASWHDNNIVYESAGKWW